MYISYYIHTCSLTLSRMAKKAVASVILPYKNFDMSGNFVFRHNLFDIIFLYLLQLTVDFSVNISYVYSITLEKDFLIANHKTRHQTLDSDTQHSLLQKQTNRNLTQSNTLSTKGKVPFTSHPFLIRTVISFQNKTRYRFSTEFFCNILSICFLAIYSFSYFLYDDNYQHNYCHNYSNNHHPRWN